MSKPGNRPDRAAPEELDEAIKTGVERAEEANELSEDELDGASGGLITPGLISRPPVDY